MIALVAPEPAAWLPAVLRSAQQAGPTVVFAPWALPSVVGRLSSSLARRTRPTELTRVVPGWIAAETLLSLWADGRADRLMQARFLTRQAVDALASRWLPAECRLVVAPSLSARRTFAAARAQGASTLLVEDIASMRELHDDLETAARRHPDAAFLRRFRASHETMAWQEAERVLATRLLLRGHHARALRVNEGRSEESILSIPSPGSASSKSAQQASRPSVLLAGLATARGGAYEVAEALREIDADLLVHAGEGTEPGDILQRPRIRAVTRAQRETLQGVSVVVAPSWCEAYPPEVEAAIARGIPVVATRRAAGFIELGDGEVEPGHVEQLRERLSSALAGGLSAQRRSLVSGLETALRS